MATEPYMTMPHRLFDEMSTGVLTIKMYLVLSWLYRRADWGTGVAKRVTAKGIIADIWVNEEDPPCERSMQEYLWRLAACGYITSQHVPGKRGNYCVTINNFTALIIGEDTAVTYELLRPMITMDWRDLPKTRCADKNMTDCGEGSGELSGEGSAYTNYSTTQASQTSKASKKVSELMSIEEENSNPASSSGGTGKTPEAEAEITEAEADKVMAEAEKLLKAFFPTGGISAVMYEEYMSDCVDIILCLEDIGISAVNLLDWNKTHKSGGLVNDTPAKLRNSLLKGESLKSQFIDHYRLGQFKRCPICKDNGWTETMLWPKAPVSNLLE